MNDSSAVALALELQETRAALHRLGEQSPSVEELELELLRRELHATRAALDRTQADLKGILEEIALVGAGWARRP